VTFTATVSPSAATGTVTFYNGSTAMGTGTLSGGVATYTTSSLPVGSNSIKATYGGGGGYNASTSLVLTQTVQNVTTTTLSSSSNPSTYGNSVTFTATVTPSTATGTVTFYNGSTKLGTGTLSSGKATYSTSTLPAGSDSITADYGGDTDDTASNSSALSQTVHQASATVTLSNMTQTYTGSGLCPTATTSPSGLGISWTNCPDTNAATYKNVTATVNNPNYTGSASGTFTISPAPVTVTLSNLTQTYTGSPLTPTATTSPTPGLGITWTGAPDTNVSKTPYSVTATVNNSNYTGSATGSFTIQPAPVTVTLSNMSQAYTGSPLCPTATTSQPPGLGITWTGAPDTNVGSYSVTATVNNPNYTGSATGIFTITTSTSTTTVASSLNPANYRRLVTFTATLSVTGSGPAPTGTVTFYNGSTAMGTATLSSNAASLTPALFPTGSFSITATYSGDTNYAGSTSPVFTQTVNAPTAGMAPNCPQ
jgi:hypothetical protein